ncbi:MAG: hypothetical protein ACI8W7_000316 [Gammaproteobacteria bacterium]|jgi:hypothetical protein
MFSKFFGKKAQTDPLADTPTIMGLRLRGSFEIDPLLLKLTASELVASDCAPTQLIKAAGIVDLDGTWIYRFYTDDDAFLQVIAEGGTSEEHVVDVKLFHFHDTQDIASKALWERLLKEEVGTASYQLEGHTYERVWTAVGDYHNPVHMAEKTYDDDGEFSETDQFTMLFERPISDGRTESLFLSAEEKEEESGNLGRCLVISTGVTLSPAQLTIHG